MITLTNATLACLWPRKLERANISIDDGRITGISGQAPAEAGEVVDCAGRVVMPGNVCGHTHLYSALARGMPAPPIAPRNFPEILAHVWWRLDRALDEKSVYYSALIGVIDAVRGGTTTLVDHHSSPNYIAGSLDTVALAFEQVGARGILCYEVTDRGGPARREQGLRENERFLRRSTPRLTGAVGAHASFTLEDETLGQLSNLATAFDTGVHIHVAEDEADQVDSLRRSGKRVVERLNGANVLRPRSILAHCVRLDGTEIQTVDRQRSWVVHNCRSNMNNAVGRASPASFGNRIGLGTDGIDGDMFAESRTAFFRAREDDLDSDADRFASMLSGSGALASEYFGVPIGTLEAGAVADLMVLEYDPPTQLTAGNLAWHWMFGMTSAMVESVMVEGAWVMRNRELLAVDEEKVRHEARADARRLWDVMGTL